MNVLRVFIRVTRDEKVQISFLTTISGIIHLEDNLLFES